MSVWSRPKYFPRDSPALYCVNHAVWPSTFLMLRPPIHPQAQIILGKYHKREDFRIEVRLPSSSTNWGKESPCIWKNPISTRCWTNLWWGCMIIMPEKPIYRRSMENTPRQLISCWSYRWYFTELFLWTALMQNHALLRYPNKLAANLYRLNHICSRTKHNGRGSGDVPADCRATPEC